MFINKRVGIFRRRKHWRQFLKLFGKFEEKEEGEDASCEKIAEAANREHQTN